jgi:hypothetical protein
MRKFFFDEKGHGEFKKTYGLGANRNSAVLASASEMIFADGAWRPHIGDAWVQVISVAPQDNGNVDLKVNVGWQSDLSYRVWIVFVE